MNNLVEVLKTDTVKLVFNKLDGTKRVMKCTQRPEITNTPIKNGSNDNLITVWDLDKDAWRSFYLDKVIMWSKVS